jgi:hypothetical protein
LRKRSAVEVEAGGRDQIRQLPEVLGERRCAGVPVDEDERPPDVDPQGHEPELRLLESGLALGAGAARSEPSRP